MISGNQEQRKLYDAHVKRMKILLDETSDVHGINQQCFFLCIDGKRGQVQKAGFGEKILFIFCVFYCMITEDGNVFLVGVDIWINLRCGE